jgi:mono/diheme cytochrome c family protein
MGQEQGAAPSARGRRGVLGIVGIAAGVLVAVIMLVAGSVYAITESRFAKTYEVPKLALSVPGPSDTEAMARGKHLAVTRGCLECHAENGAGRLFIDEMPVMQLRPPNITPGGRVKTYSAADWERAIRHGVHPDGTPILFMPVEDYRMMADDDLADLIGYLKTLPAVENDPGPSTIGPVGRVLYLLGELPLTVADHLDHAAQVPPAPTRGPTSEYGKYLAYTCTGCHGAGFSGGPIPGVPPDWPPAGNLTQGGALGSYDLGQFLTVMRTGKTPKGHQINPGHMPWKQLGQLGDDELEGLFHYLKTVPAKPDGSR